MSFQTAISFDDEIPEGFDVNKFVNGFVADFWDTKTNGKARWEGALGEIPRGVHILTLKFDTGVAILAMHLYMKAKIPTGLLHVPSFVEFGRDISKILMRAWSIRIKNKYGEHAPVLMPTLKDLDEESFRAKFSQGAARMAQRREAPADTEQSDA